MTYAGKVINGRIELVTPRELPEGASVEVNVRTAAEATRYEEELQILRESIADAKAGRNGIPLDDFMVQLALKYNLTIEE